jgi:hypothetical protein
VSGLPITPETKVGELLEAYPALEETLVAMAPTFAKLKNPILRRTVARVATLAQAARVGGVEPREMVRTLRREAGLPDEPSAAEAAASGEVADAPPAWLDETRVVARLDADAILARGEHPLGAVQGAATGLSAGDQLLLSSGFLPAPLLDAMRGRGFETASYRGADGRIVTAIRPGGERGPTAP